MAGNYAAVSVGRMVGALAGPLLFEIGLLANGITAVVAEVVAPAVLLAFVRTGDGEGALYLCPAEPPPGPQPVADHPPPCKGEESAPEGRWWGVRWWPAGTYMIALSRK